MAPRLGFLDLSDCHCTILQGSALSVCREREREREMKKKIQTKRQIETDGEMDSEGEIRMKEIPTGRDKERE